MAKQILKELFFKSSDTSKVKYNIGADAENILIKNENGTAYGDTDKHKNLQSKLNILNKMIRTSSSEGYSHVPGNAEGSYSTAFGINTRAKGWASHAEGEGTVARLLGCHAEGRNCHAGEDRTGGVLSGNNADAPGNYAHAEGDATAAKGRAAHSEGIDTYAGKRGAHAEGGNVHVDHEYAHGEGYGTRAARAYQHVQGKWNVEESDKVHIVGWGENDTNRSNIHTLDTNGNAWFRGGINATTFNGYSINASVRKEVPSNAVFTDRNVRRTNISTHTGNFPLLLAANSSDAIGEVHFDSGVTLNTSTNTINASITGSAEKLSNTSAIGSDTQPVYFSSSGVPVACSVDLNTKADKENPEITGGILLTDSETNLKYYISIQSGQLSIQSKGQTLLADSSGGLGQKKYFIGDSFNKEYWTFKLRREDGTESIIPYSKLSYSEKVTENPFIVTYEERGEVYKCELLFDIYELPEGLEDFDYNRTDFERFEITSWKGTYQGSQSTRMVFPVPSASSNQIIIKM